MQQNLMSFRQHRLSLVTVCLQKWFTGWGGWCLGSISTDLGPVECLLWPEEIQRKLVEICRFTRSSQFSAMQPYHVFIRYVLFVFYF